MNTADIINQMNPQEITLTRRTRVDDGPNFTWEEEELDPQTFGVYYARSGQNIERVTIEKDVREVELMLLCPIDADITGGPGEDTRDSQDVFIYGDRKYRVVYVREYKGFGLPNFEMKQAGCISL